MFSHFILLCHNWFLFLHQTWDFDYSIATDILEDDDYDVDKRTFNKFVINRTNAELICQDAYQDNGNNRTLRHCYDREDCKVYGDCCRNSTHYVEREQTAQIGGAGGRIYGNSRYGCYRVDPDLVALMIGQCPPGVDPDIRDKCEKTSDDDDDFVSRYPVTSTRTGHVYRNAYCAWCQGERRRVVYWKPVFRCSGTAAAFRLDNASADHGLSYRHGRWYHEDRERRVRLPCDFRLRRPPGTDARPCSAAQQSAGLVDGCPAGAPDELARNCASRTYTLFEYASTEPRVFRNADCARCNGVATDRMTCAPPAASVLSAVWPGGAVGVGFDSLFSVTAAEYRGAEPACAPDELYDVAAAKCRDVFRDRLAAACRTYVRFGPGEYDGRSLDNGTAYVYAYKKRVRYRNGSDPRATDGAGPLDACAEDEDGLPLRTATLSAYASYLADAGVLGSAVSAAALIAHLALFCGAGAAPRNLPEKNLAALAASLLLGHGGYLAIALRAVRPGANVPCLASALAVHFGFLAAFAWSFVMSVDAWIVFRASAKKLRVAGGRRTGRFAAYSAFAWLAPLALAAFAAALQLSAVRALPELRPNFQYDCWFRNPRSLVALFVLPAGVVVAANCASFVCVVRSIAAADGGRFRSAAAAADPSAVSRGRTRRNFKIYARLSTMMGLAWAFGLAGAVTDSDVAWTAYTALNSFQGAFVFVAFDCGRWRRTAARALSAFRKIPRSGSEAPATASSTAAATATSASA